MTDDEARVTTFHPDGSAESRAVAPEPPPIAEAVRAAIAALGDVLVDESAAPGQLRVLAESYEQVTRARAIHAQKASEAKDARKFLDATIETLLAQVQAFTYVVLPPPARLPLFDEAAPGDLSTDPTAEDVAALDAAPAEAVFAPESVVDDARLNRPLHSHQRRRGLRVATPAVAADGSDDPVTD